MTNPTRPARPLAAVTLAACFAFTMLSVLPAQTTSVVPSICATLPGNAALAMPLRWSQGAMQVFVDPQLLPANFIGQTITGVRLRRPTLPGDVAYPAMTRTLTVRGGFQQTIAAQMYGGGLTQNRPASAVVLFGPATVAVPATAAPGPTTVLGEDYLQIVFSTPLPVVAGTLYLEFEAGDGPLQVSQDHWVDAVWLEDAVDHGFVAAVGDGSCTTAVEPTRLQWSAAMGPNAGTTAALEMRGAPAGSIVLAWMGLDPLTRPAGAGYLGFGGDLSILGPTLSGCHQWAPLDVAWFGVANPSGVFATGFPIPSSAVTGTRLGVQAAWLDPARSGAIPFSFSNGLVLVLNSAGVSYRCSTLFFPGTSTTSPWLPFLGQMPVLMLEH